MKLLRVGKRGEEVPAILDADGNIRDLSGQVPDIGGGTLLPEQLAKLAALDVSTLPRLSESLRIGACIADVGKFICIGLNYEDHARETGADIPTEPVVFSKWTSAICGPNDPILKPRNSTALDWEVELGVVIGKPGKYIKPDKADEHIAGYCIVHDVSERHFQLERGGQWDKGKGCDNFGPIGPWMVTADEVGDVGNLGIWLEVNGHRYQNGSTRWMIFTPQEIVSYLSNFMSLQIRRTSSRQARHRAWAWGSTHPVI